MGVIEEIRSGNKEAIKEVYKENVKDVYNFAKSITGNHETALDATKKTFVLLFNRIQKGENPTNIRLAALKIAYDEACAIAMPSTEAIDSPYDKKAQKEEMSFKVSDEPAAGSNSQDIVSKDVKPSAYKGNISDNNSQNVQPQVSEPLKENEKQPQASEPAKASKENKKSKKEKDTREKQGREKPGKEEKKKEKSDKKTNRVYVGVDEDLDFEDASGESYTPGRKKDESREDINSGYVDEPEEKKQHPVLSTILLIINIILIIILVWFVLGLLQNLEIIPDTINMGHNWFNTHIYPLF